MLRSLVTRLFRDAETESSPSRLRPVTRNRRRHLSAEALDQRRMLTSQIYLDFGDAFPTGGLAMTAADLSGTLGAGGLQGPDLAAAGLAPTTPIRFSSPSSLITFDYNQNGVTNSQDYADLKASVLSLMQRYYAGLDANVQIAPTLNSTSSAAYLAGIRSTLQQGSTAVGEGDAWIFIATATRTDITNPLIPVTTSIGTTLNTYGLAPTEVGDLNTNDNTAVVFADRFFPTFANFNIDTALAQVAAAQAAHTFGLGRSAFNNLQFVSPNVPVAIPDISTVTSTINITSHDTIADLNVRFNLIHTFDSDLRISLISPTGTTVILSNQRGGSGDNFFDTIFDDEAPTPIASGAAPFNGSYRPESPLTAFDGQDTFGTWTLRIEDIVGIDFGTLNSFSLTIQTPVYTPNADDLQLGRSDVMALIPDDNIAMFARFPMNDYRPGRTINHYDFLADTQHLGPAASGVAYVTGTGANDVITVTATGANTAQVTVTAYRTSNRTSPLTVPGTLGGTTYSYSINTANGVIIDAGYGNDRIIVSASLASDVALRGMAGIDEVVVDGGTTALYSPSTKTTVGLDGAQSWSGTVAASSLIRFSEFESTSTIGFTNLGALTVRMPNGVDVLSFDNAGGGYDRLSGTTGGIGVIPISYSKVGSVVLDSTTADTATSADTIVVNSLAATGLLNLSLLTGAGNDSLSLPVLPGTGATLTFDGGVGSDKVAITSDQKQYTIAATAMTTSAGGTFNYSNLETASITSGAGTNSFLVNSWAKIAALTLDGGAGTDVFDIGSGSIAPVLGKITVVGGSGTDQMSIQDSLTTGNYGYTIAKNLVTSTLGKQSRAFTSLAFDSTMDFVTLNASSGANRVNVKAAQHTEFSINGGDPTTANADILLTDVYGTIGRKLTYDPTTGSGDWAFHGSLYGGANFKPIAFTGFEKVVNPLAFSGAASDANTLGQPLVRYLDLASGENTTFLAYESTFRSGVRTITADLNNDGQLEIVTAPVRGRAAEIRVFSSKGVENKAFRTLAYAANFLGGVNIAIADVNGDKLPDLIAVPSLGRAEVRIYLNQGGKTFAKTPAYQFYAFPPQYIGGATVGAGDFNGDGRAEIVVGSGIGKVSSVVVFDTRGITAKGVSPTPLYQYSNFFPSSFLGGIGSVVVARANADSTPDVIVTQSNGGKSLVATLDGISGRRAGTGYAKTKVLYAFAAYADTNNSAAVTAVVRDLDLDGLVDTIFTGQSSDGKTRGVLRQFKMYTNVAIDNPLFGNPKFFGYAVG
jgi:subtilisin-like proprotein convertase family protein